MQKVVIYTVILLTCQQASTQEKWGVHFKPSMNFVTEDLDILDSQVGFGFEFDISYKFIDYFEAYAGWNWNSFKIKTDETNSNDLDTFGYTFGLHFIHPAKSTNLSYFAQIGGFYNIMRLENENGRTVAESDNGLGWEIAAGVEIALGSSTWHLRPQIGFRSFSRDLVINNLNSQIQLNHIFLSNGLIKRF